MWIHREVHNSESQGEEDSNMVKASVPNFFICPISLQLMKDPVTLMTGQTYDRKSIEKWFAEGHNTCPSTMQVLSSMHTAPNNSLQRLIQEWCSSNNYSLGPTVEDPVSVVSSTNEAKRRPVTDMLRDVTTKRGNSLKTLKELRCLAKDLNLGTRIRAALAEAGAMVVLANFVFSPHSLGKDARACEEALGILILLPLQDMRKLVYIGSKQLTVISWLLNKGSIDGRVNAAQLLGSLAHDGDKELKAVVGSTAGIFEGLVQLIKEDLYLKAVNAGLNAILTLISSGPDKNIARAVEIGVVYGLVDLLLETQRKSQLQILTKLMELLCSSPDGRRAVTAHALVVPLLVKIIVNDIPTTSETAISCLWTICQHSPDRCVDEAAGQMGILSQLSRFAAFRHLQIDATTKQRAAQLLQQIRHNLDNCSPRS